MITRSTLALQEAFTAIPNRFLDEIAPTLTAAELRVMLYAYRHTLGFQRTSDNLSYEQFTDGIVCHDGKRLDSGAGVCRQSLVKALSGLQTKGLITRHKNAYAATTTRLTPLAAITAKPAAVKVQEIGCEPDAPVQEITPPIETELIPEKEEDRAVAVQLVEIIPGLTAKQAGQSIQTARKHARALSDLFALAYYVTSAPGIRTPAAVFKTLVDRNEVRAATATTGQKPPRRATKPAGGLDMQKYTTGGKYAWMSQPTAVSGG